MPFGNQQAISPLLSHQALSHMEEAPLILQKYRLTFQLKRKTNRVIKSCSVTPRPNNDLVIIDFKEADHFFATENSFQATGRISMSLKKKQVR